MGATQASGTQGKGEKQLKILSPCEMPEPRSDPWGLRLPVLLQQAVSPYL